MNLPVVVLTTVAMCLAWSIAAFGPHTVNQFNERHQAQQMNRHSVWSDDSPTIMPSPNGVRSGAITASKHYPMTTSRYQATNVGNGRLFSEDDYYDTDAIANPSRLHDRLDDYPTIEYPIYNADDYYPVTDSYNEPSYEDDTMAYDRDEHNEPISSTYYPINRYASTPVNRYESTRYPTDSLHKFHEVFVPNTVSPSNAFKTAKERQLYNFWQFLIDGDAERSRQTYDDDDNDNYDYENPQQQQPSFESDMISLLHKYYFRPTTQKFIQQQQQRQPAKERMPFVTPPPFSPLSLPAKMSQAIHHSNIYELWKNGSPLVKKSNIAANDLKRLTPLLTMTTTSSDNNDVRQLENLKTVYVTTTMTTAVPRIMYGRGQREFVMPGLADDKLSFKDILKLIAKYDQKYFDGNVPPYDKVSIFRKLLCSLKQRFTPKVKYSHFSFSRSNEVFKRILVMFLFIFIFD